MGINITPKPVILVVDDQPENILVLKESLISDYTVKLATSGKIALKAAGVEPYPDLVLLDIMMPEMDGYEVCRQLKERDETKDIPIIFVTAKADENDELFGLNLGAVDYITKPIKIPILKARVKTHLALQAANSKLEKYNQRLIHEREMIEEIILNMRDTEGFDARHLRFLVAPVEVTAGDMLLSTVTPDGRQLVLLGDFTGHGLPAAIGGPLVTYMLYDLAKRGYSGTDILREINNQLCSKLPVGVFFAVMLLEISSDRKQTSVWNSALPDGLLIREGKVQHRFPSELVPLGISKTIDIAGMVKTLSTKKGDRLFAFSDGIVEAMGIQGDMFGIDRLQVFLEKSTLSDCPLEDLLVLLENHTGTSEHDDDITLVEVKF